MTFIIVEIGQAHDGSLGILHSFIDALGQSGADAIKFQTHIAEAESSVNEPFRVKFSYEDESRFDYWKRMSFTLCQWKGIKKHCDQVGLEFMSSPFSNAAVDLLEKVGVRRYKVGSGEVSNLFLLEKIARTGKRILLSSGMSSYTELERSIEFLSHYNSEVSILQCTTRYPTLAEDLGLNVIDELRQRFDLSVGFSDHSGTIFAPLAAVAKGAEIIEVHVTFDQRMFGPDSNSSLNIDQFVELVHAIRYLDRALAQPIDKENTIQFRELKAMFGKTLAFSRAMKKGEIIQFEDLEHKKPAGLGVSAEKYQEIIGKKMICDKAQWEFVQEDDICG